MNQCPKCAALNDDSANFCVGCGNVLEKEAPKPQSTNTYNSYTQPTTYQQPNYYNNTSYGYTRITENMLPLELKPLSVWQYIGYGFLFGLPIAGFIILILSAFDSSKNVNLRNYAKSILVMYVIGFVVTIFVSILAVMFGAMFGAAEYY